MLERDRRSTALREKNEVGEKVSGSSSSRTERLLDPSTASSSEPNPCRWWEGFHRLPNVSVIVRPRRLARYASAWFAASPSHLSCDTVGPDTKAETYGDEDDAFALVEVVLNEVVDLLKMLVEVCWLRRLSEELFGGELLGFCHRCELRRASREREMMRGSNLARLSLLLFTRCFFTHSEDETSKSPIIHPLPVPPPSQRS